MGAVSCALGVSQRPDCWTGVHLLVLLSTRKQILAFTQLSNSSHAIVACVYPTKNSHVTKVSLRNLQLRFKLQFSAARELLQESGSVQKTVVVLPPSVETAEHVHFKDIQKLCFIS